MNARIIIVLFVLIIIVSFMLCIINLNSNRNNGGFINIADNMTIDNSIKKVDTEIISSASNDYNESDFYSETETIITLVDNNTTVDGENVKIDGNNIYITSGGTYRVTGVLSDGRIIVNAPKEKVKIILDNVSINCSYSSALFIYKSSATMIYIKDDTINSINDGITYNYNDEFSIEDDEEPNSAIYSKSDLIICGKGTLNVNANFNKGITSKDTLYIEDVTINVNAKNHGINGKDNSTFKNAIINITSGGDGIRSTNDKDSSLGWIKIINSSIKIDSKEDAIQAETDLVINGGTIDIKAGDGSTSLNKIDNSIFGREKWGINTSNSTAEETSRKGIKATRYILITNNAVINIDSVDDAIHSNASLQIDFGVINIKTGDDGIHADDTVTINYGTITISESYEGIEGNNIVINDGVIDVKSSDDGINVNGGNDGSGFGGFDGFEKGEDSSYKIIINGGTITINANGDGIDSNGSIEMNGGNVLVQGPTNAMNGAIDYEKSFILNGGTIIAIGSSGMAQGVKSESQASIFATIKENQSENTKIEIKDETGKTILETTSEKPFNNIVASSKDIKTNKTYSIYINGNLDSEVTATLNSSGNGFGGFGRMSRNR